MSLIFCSYLIFCFFFHDTATTEIDTYCHTLSLHDALPIWSDEVARHLMIWLTFIGAGLTLRHGGLVAIDNVQTAMSPRNARLMRIVVAVIMFAFFATMIWRSEEHTSELQSLMRTSYAVFCLKTKNQYASITQ